MPNFQTLRLGDTGPQVQLLQLALSRAGYNPGPPDGIFGDRTRGALVRWQSASGRMADGVAGPQTASGLRPYLLGYLTHTVARGDTLYRLAARYGASLRAVETANPGIDPLALRPGQKLIIPLPFAVVPTEVSCTSTLTALCLEGLRARYPFLRLGRFGTSVLGKPLHFATLGRGPYRVFYNGSHHANEWITTLLLLRFLEEYARALAFGGALFGLEARALAAETTLVLAPLVNPDGVDLVTGALADGPAYRRAAAFAQDYPEIPFPLGWKANLQGIDLNLQYPAGWEEAKAIKYAQGFVSPGPRDYVGPGPLTAPESRAVYEFARAGDFHLTLSYHTQGQVIYWKYLDYAPPQAEAIGQQFAQVSGYLLEDTPYASGYAGFKDWFLETYRRPGFTIEAGTGVSPLPLSQFKEIYRDNEGILTLGLVPPEDDG